MIFIEKSYLTEVIDINTIQCGSDEQRHIQE